MFAQHSIPDQSLSDELPAVLSKHIFKFQEEFGLTHITSSPYRKVECAVQTEKLTKEGIRPIKSPDGQATPLESNLRPTELLMERKIQTMVPILPSQLEPGWPYLEQFRERYSAEDTLLRASQTSCQEILFGYLAKRLRGQ